MSGETQPNDRAMELARTKADQYYWQFQDYVRRPEAYDTELAFQLLDESYGEHLFNALCELGKSTLEKFPEFLQIPEFRRFAEYFGVIQVQEDGVDKIRGFGDISRPILLPGEEIFIRHDVGEN
jgi:hypothetical protein